MARDISRLDGERAIAQLRRLDRPHRQGRAAVRQAARGRRGIERNLVITMWDYCAPQFYLHDVVSTDRRNPRVNPNGAVYALAGGLAPTSSAVVDPRTNRAIDLPHPVRDPNTPSVKAQPYGVVGVLGRQALLGRPHAEPQPDDGREGRAPGSPRASARTPNPDWCKSGSDHRRRRRSRSNGGANRHLGMFDPYTNQWTLIRTCFPTHHLNFDKDGMLWTSAGVVGPGVIGWLDVKKFEQTGGRARLAGLDAVHPRHQRRRQARRIRRARQAARSEEGQAGDAQSVRDRGRARPTARCGAR